MQQYRIKEVGIKRIRIQILKKVLPFMLVVFAAGIAMTIQNFHGQGSNMTISLTMAACFVVGGGGIYNSIHRRKAILDSYKLTLTGNLLTQEQQNTRTISIYFNDIKKIAKAKNGNLFIYGKDKDDIIGIPVEIESYVQLTETLAGIKAITTLVPPNFIYRNPQIFLLLILGLFICVYTTHNKIVVTLTGIPLVVFMIWSIYKVRTSKNVDIKIKRMIWFTLLPMLSVIATIIVRLLGY